MSVKEKTCSGSQKIILPKNCISTKMLRHSKTGILVTQGSPVEIIYANNALEKMLGYPKAGLLNLNPQEVICLVHPDDRQKFFAHHKKMLSGGKLSSSFEFKAVKKNGEIKSFQYNAAKIICNGKSAIQSALTDITETKQLELKLKHERDWSERLIREAPNIVLGLDRDFKVILSNKRLEEITGYNHTEIMNKLWPNTFIPRRLRPTIWKVWGKIIKAEKIEHHFVNPILTKSGEERIISWSNHFIKENGSFKMVFSVGDDVTEEVKKNQLIANNAKKLASLLNSMDDLVFEFDKKGFFVFHHSPENSPLYTPKEVFLGKHFSKILPPNVSRLLQKGLQKNRQKQKTSFQYSLTIGNKALWFEANLSPIIQDKEYQGSVAVVRDITKNKEIDIMKTEFVSVASHQLRTPITSIGWNCELLLENKQETLSEKQRELLGEVKKSNKRMTVLINALLNVARLEMGTVVVAPKKIAPRDICLSIINEHQAEITQKKLKIIESSDPKIKSIKADPKLLSIIFENLLSNAIKYSPDQRIIKISTKKMTSDMLITIADQGMGIGEDEKDKIFTKLYRTDTAKIKDPDGTGLGLYIIKLILNQCGGKIWFESNVGKGSTFYVSLPLKGMRKLEGNKPLI